MAPPRKRPDFALYGGLAAATLLLLFFGWLAREMLAGRTLAFDMEVRSAIHAHAFPALTLAMRYITWTGSIVVMGPAGILIAWVWVSRGRRRAAILFAITVGGAALLDGVLKAAFHRPRPVPFFGLAAPLSPSFPSGHALVSCCFYGALAGLSARRPRWAVWAAAAMLVAAIGFSRIYLGVHYPSDVIAGYATGAVWVLAVRSAYRS